MSNRYAEKIKKRRKKIEENKPPTFTVIPNKTQISIVAVALILVIIFLTYFAYKNNFFNELIFPIGVAILYLLFLFLWYVPKFYVASLPNEAGKFFDHENAKLKLEDDTRKTFAQIVGGIVILLGLIFTYNTFRLQQDTYRLQQEGQYTDRFTKAIAQIGDEKLEVRLGGLYALERIAKDSPKDHWTVIEVISAFIRERAKKREEAIKNTEINSNNNLNNNTDSQNKSSKIATDIQAALTIIGRRKIEQDSKTERIDLSRTDLSNADLSNADFSNANLYNVNLSKTNLTNTNLSGAFLFNSDLSFSKLFYTNLNKADIGEVNLDHVQLVGVDLRGTILIGIKPTLEFEHLNKSIIDERTILPSELENRRKELIEASKDSDHQRSMKIILEDGIIKDKENNNNK